MPFKHPSPQERILSNSVLDEHSDCWLWLGRHSAGYGRINVRQDGRHTTQLAHRYTYEAFVGPIPAGMELDHKCYNPICVNPYHIEPVAPAENLARRRRYKK